VPSLGFIFVFGTACLCLGLLVGFLLGARFGWMKSLPPHLRVERKESKKVEELARRSDRMFDKKEDAILESANKLRKSNNELGL